jgi:hypothetical protein
MRRNASSPENGDGANNLKPSQKCDGSETDPAEAKLQNVPSSANSATDGISPVNPNIDRKRKWIMTDTELLENNALLALLQIYRNTFAESDVSAEVMAEAKKHVRKMIDPDKAVPKWAVIKGERLVMWVQ